VLSGADGVSDSVAEVVAGGVDVSVGAALAGSSSGVAVGVGSGSVGVGWATGRCLSGVSSETRVAGELRCRGAGSGATA
jgi:hypothetical protein